LSIEYLPHARLRMKERSISESEVKECLDNWSTCYTDKKGNPIYKAAVKGRGIKVVVTKENPTLIITVADY
jgi:hypothetical protein